VPEAPFRGTPFAVGQQIQAEDYDVGGEGVSYHDTSSWNEGGDTYRAGGVDTGWSASEQSHYVGWTHGGEWMKYTVNVDKAGTYAFGARVASALSGSSFHLEVDGKQVGSSVSVPNTGSWDSYATAVLKNVKLGAGKHVLTVVIDGQTKSAGNFDWFEVAPASTFATPTAKAAKVKKAKAAKKK
jgi:hypothetical protein